MAVFLQEAHLNHFEHVGENPDPMADEEDDDDVERDSGEIDLPSSKCVSSSRRRQRRRRHQGVGLQILRGPGFIRLRLRARR